MFDYIFEKLAERAARARFIYIRFPQQDWKELAEFCREHGREDLLVRARPMYVPMIEIPLHKVGLARFPGPPHDDLV